MIRELPVAGLMIWVPLRVQERIRLPFGDQCGHSLATGLPGITWCRWLPSGLTVKSTWSSIAGSHRPNTILPF